MKQEIIKTELLVDDLFSRKKWQRIPLYILPKEESEAEKFYEKGERVYSIDLHNKIYGDLSCRKYLRTLEEIHEAYSSGMICGVRMPKTRLLDEEYNLLNKLATRSGEECWFWLIEKDEKDMVKDLEENRVMSLKNALPIFVGALLDLDHYFLSEEEKEIAYRLFDRFNIEYKPV